VTVHLSAGPPPVPVPDLTGLTADLAGQRLIGAGLLPGKQTPRSDDNVPAGNVISWTGAGGQLAKGSAVDLVVSTGKPRVAVPDVHNQSLAAAHAALVSAGLTGVRSDVFSDTVPVGQVVSTAPATGTSVIVGSQVSINVSKGPQLVAVPPVAALTLDAATKRLEAFGFMVTGVIGAPDRPVTATTPAAGTMLRKGSAVKLITG
jgi:serine/threonine-protein kinase